MMQGCRLRLKADLLCLRRTPFVWLHLVLPVAASTVFLIYFSITNYDDLTMQMAYKQVLAVVLPLVISLICSIMVEVEWVGGRYYHVLSAAGSRVHVLASKLLLLFVSGFSAIQAAVWLFDGVFAFTISESKHWSIGESFVTASILFGSSMVFYMFHIWLNMRFGKEVSLGMGILGVLISALMQTGLGDGRLWTFTPYGWSSRFVTYRLAVENKTAYDSSMLNLSHGVIIACMASLTSIVLLFLWFKRWEGNGGED